MLEVMSSNKDIQIDIKTKHEELVKILDNKIDELLSNIQSLDNSVTKIVNELKNILIEKMDNYTKTQEKQSKYLLVLAILVAITFLFNLIPFVMQFINR